jgi:hypothetical protein
MVGILYKDYSIDFVNYVDGLKMLNKQTTYTCEPL